MPPIPYTVKTSKLDTQFRSGHTIHTLPCDVDSSERDQQQKVQQKWQRERKLGGGSYGQVYLERLVEDRENIQFRAVKALPKKKTQNYFRELEAVVLFSHEKYDHCFVKYFGWYDDSESIFIAMEYLPHGDLQDHLTAPLEEMEAQTVVAQLLQGLAFMHGAHFTHRDLKPQNVLVQRPGPDWRVKIADFGISKRVEDENTALRTVAGTPAFIAPEVLGLIQHEAAGSGGRRTYTNAVDVWSLGAITFQLLTSTLPFTDLGHLARFTTGLDVFPLLLLTGHNVTHQGCEFVACLMSPVPEKRPSVIQLLQHPWLQSRMSSDTLHMQRLSLNLATHLLDQNEVKTEQLDDLDRDCGASAVWTTMSSKILSDNEDDVDLPSRQKSYTNTSKTGQAKESQDETDSVQGDTELENARAMVERGRSLFENAKDLEAENNFQTAVEIFTKLLGSDHVDTAASLHWLGSVQFEQDKHEAAERSLQTAYKTREKLFGFTNEDTASSLYMLGQAQLEQDKYAAAERSLQAAYDVHEKLLGHNRSETANSLYMLGLAQFEQGKFSTAEQSLQTATKIREEVLGHDDKATAFSLYWLGQTQFEQDKYAAAEQTMQAAYDIRKKVLGPQHNLTGYSLHWLGQAQFEQQKYSVAVQNLQIALGIRQQMLGPTHKETLITQQWLDKSKGMMPQQKPKDKRVSRMYSALRAKFTR